MKYITTTFSNCDIMLYVFSALLDINNVINEKYIIIIIDQIGMGYPN